MAVFNTLIFDGESSLDHGIYITGEAVYNAPEREVEMISIPGKNGALAIDRGRFQNIEVEYPAGCFGSDHGRFASKIREFRNILASRYSYRRLTDSYHPDEFRLGLYRSGLDVDPVHYGTAGEFKIKFDCKPQRFLVSGEEKIEVTGDRIIENPTLFASDPILKVTGNGSITIGDYRVTIAGNSGTIWIDSELNDYYIPAGTLEPLTDENLVVITDDSGIPIEVISGSGSLTPIRPSGVTVNFARHEYPKLNPGQNVVYISEIDSLVVIPRWWII